MYDDILVIIVYVASCEIRRVLIDNGSSFDLIYLTTLTEMRVPSLKITKKELPLIGFNGSMMISVGTIKLLVLVPGAIILKNFGVLDIL